MSSHSSSVKIILKIWVAALFMNTLFGTAALTDIYTDAEMVGPIAVLGFFYAGVFTLPFTSLLFVFLRLFVRMEINGKKLFTYFFVAGLMLTLACFTMFFLVIGSAGFPVGSLFLIAMGSSAVSMLLEYRAVLQLGKDENEKFYNSFLE